MLRYRLPALVAALMLSATLASCGQESSSSGSQVSYKEVKSMVIDILGSEEAQKAIEKASTAQYGESTLQMKAMTPKDQEQVRIAIKDVLTSPNYTRVLETIMKDEKFAGEFAKAVSKDNKQIHKDLIKDPTYQQDLMTMFKEPGMQTVLAESMKTSEYRKQMQATVTDVLQSPVFKLEIMKLLQKAVKEELTPASEKKQAESGQGGGSEGEGQDGGQGGGDGGGGGGGGGQ